VEADLILERSLATPLIWYPGQSDEELKIEMARMIERSFAIRAFMEGKINWDDFLCLLQEHEIDAAAADNGWQEGLIYL
jgi:hypothetical protein